MMSERPGVPGEPEGGRTDSPALPARCQQRLQMLPSWLACKSPSSSETLCNAWKGSSFAGPAGVCGPGEPGLLPGLPGSPPPSPPSPQHPCRCLARLSASFHFRAGGRKPEWPGCFRSHILLQTCGPEALGSWPPFLALGGRPLLPA